MFDDGRTSAAGRECDEILDRYVPSVCAWRPTLSPVDGQLTSADD